VLYLGEVFSSLREAPWRHKPYPAVVRSHEPYCTVWRHTYYSVLCGATHNILLCATPHTHPFVWRHTQYSVLCDATHSILFCAMPHIVFCFCVAPLIVSCYVRRHKQFFATVWPHKPYSAATCRRFKQGYQSQIIRGPNESFS